MGSMKMPIKRSKYDIAVNLLCLLLLFGIVVYLVVNWNHIPNVIPGHYNAAGEVDRWGNKGELMILPLIGWMMYIGITVLERFPQVWNTGVAITEENKTKVYRILKDMIGTTKLIVVIVFDYLALNSASSDSLPVWFLPVFLILLFSSLLFFIVKLVRAK